jgi:membrane fusion protein, heavy metal efflux system
VPLGALQRFRDWDVVFVNEGGIYQAIPVKLGRRDGTHVEVLDGLHAGARMVIGNSYLVKADIEKSGASHDH